MTYRAQNTKCLSFLRLVYNFWYCPLAVRSIETVIFETDGGEDVLRSSWAMSAFFSRSTEVKIA